MNIYIIFIFPFFKNLILQMGILFIPFGLFVIIGSSNAVNLTDGLDGLATVPVMLVALSFTLISYVVGNTIFSEYLQIQYIPDVGELSIFCGSVVGACLGFGMCSTSKDFYGRYWIAFTWRIIGGHRNNC